MSGLNESIMNGINDLNVYEIIGVLILALLSGILSGYVTSKIGDV